MPTVRNTSDHQAAAPALRCFLNLGTLASPPPFFTGPRLDDADLYHRIAEAGYQGVQGGDPVRCSEANLLQAGGARVNTPAEADNIAKQARDGGQVCTTLHVAWGLEDDDAVDRLVDAILNASARHDLPMYIETHRATITDDMWRTVKLTERFPDIRFNGDFSHWYTGHEMVYGGFENKLAFIEPVLDRCWNEVVRRHTPW